MKYDRSYGIILFYRFPRSLKFLILKHAKGHWAFPKGHAEKGETKLKTAKRELKEETRITDIELISKRVQLEERYNITRGGKSIKKIVEYFIAESHTTKAVIDKKEILNYRWCTAEGAKKQLTYPKSVALMKKANKLILKSLDK